MKTKLKQILVPFLSMIVINFILYSDYFLELGIESPYVGLLFVFGLLFGPYGALGAVLGNIVIDYIGGFTPIEILPSAIFSFGVSCLAYKLWYSGFKTDKITKPKLDNIYHLSLFLSIMIICGIIYSAIHGKLVGLIIRTDIIDFFTPSYFLNFVNGAFIFGIVSLFISDKIDFIHTPKTTKKAFNRKLYRILFYLLLISAIIAFITSEFDMGKNAIIGEIIVIGILLFAYLTKPFEYEIQPNDENTMIESIMRNFLIVTLALAILGIVVSIFSYKYVASLDANIFITLLPLLIITDVFIIMFFIPGMIIFRYIERKLIKPISSFSKIENFINENEKIEAEGLLDIYSEYVNEKNEIGTLARSYSKLIEHNNNYIENIREIESEKERVNAELDIATKIQAAALPTEALETDEFIVNGYSHPAKEVGGDFFDYYMIDDDNLAIVIGDASGKGVPAAILAMITQVIIKQLIKHETDPSKVLCSLNNQLSVNNSESMFITIWLGIYNKSSKKIIFSNAGHNPPLIKENGEFKYLDIDTGLVLGIMEDFGYVKEEITLTNELVLYTDGITDANNNRNEMYGEDRLLKFFNEFKSDEGPIIPLLKDISEFTEDAQQYDDMTLLYLKDKS
ncbi:MAG: PP2C family protein-serine/threonine phosphatase [Methanobrevibacter sp.]|uniref:PP2C family protein-serine/threonine phosphatase n=1 Tax=Methanobrevibacter sp. TaxID=66852 RepID=UPI0025DAF3A8|nr:PP2C family protein-serine/threonine phosphatase [Methanobrevibacter sp.]MBR3112771.1 PP2C family protein-serine/threonine phosphatase [Methanobrevibacter sp.]MBR6992646.1 PP2C family protein-serine/threonine phosphatase [Methanobrevibacter sp.]